MFSLFCLEWRARAIKKIKKSRTEGGPKQEGKNTVGKSCLFVYIEVYSCIFTSFSLLHNSYSTHVCF
jgi:hypothetical protein